MFTSLKNDYSLKEEDHRWTPIKDKEELLRRIRQLSTNNIPYMIYGKDYLGNPQSITHRFCERMLWNGYGIGLKKGL